MGSRNLKESSVSYLKEVGTGAGIILKRIWASLINTSGAMVGRKSPPEMSDEVRVHDHDADGIFVQEDVSEGQPYLAGEQIEERTADVAAEVHGELFEELYTSDDKDDDISETAVVQDVCTEAPVCEAVVTAADNICADNYIVDFLPPLSEPHRRVPVRMHHEPVPDETQIAEVTVPVADTAVDIEPTCADGQMVINAVIDPDSFEIKFNPINVDIDHNPFGINIEHAVVADVYDEAIPVVEQEEGMDRETAVEMPIVTAVAEITEETAEAEIITVPLLEVAEEDDTEVLFDPVEMPIVTAVAETEISEEIPEEEAEVFIELSVPAAETGPSAVSCGTLTEEMSLSDVLPSDVLAIFDEKDSYCSNEDAAEIPVCEEMIEHIEEEAASAEDPVSAAAAEPAKEAGGGIAFSFFSPSRGANGTPAITFTFGRPQPEEDDDIFTQVQEETDTTFRDDGVFAVGPVISTGDSIQF